jgi:hypothetical protein
VNNNKPLETDRFEESEAKYKNDEKEEEEEEEGQLKGTHYFERKGCLNRANDKDK